MFTVKPLHPGDIDEIMAMVGEAIRQMESESIDQWNEDYPTREVFLSDLSVGTLFGIEQDDKILGIITVNEEQSPEYEELSWEGPNDNVAVIHRLVVHPQYQRQGLARILMDFAEDHAKKGGYDSIRLDAYSKNPRALRLYEQRGYKKIGKVMFPERNSPFFCYELILKET